MKVTYRTRSVITKEEILRYQALSRLLVIDAKNNGDEIEEDKLYDDFITYFKTLKPLQLENLLDKCFYKIAVNLYTGQGDKLKRGIANIGAKSKEITFLYNHKEKYPLSIIALDVTGIKFRQLEYIIPNSAGIYYLLDENSDILYVGSSKNLNSRFSNHISKKEKKFRYVTWFVTPDLNRKELELIEYSIIKWLMKLDRIPKYNKLFCFN